MNILLLVIQSKYAQGAIGVLIGAKLIGTPNDEALKQLVQMIVALNGG